MKRLDRQFRKESGLTDRRHYSIFYSRIVPCSTFVVGYNPGGEPGTWSTDSLASTGFYENWEHEYVDCDYPLARAMQKYLPAVLSLSDVEAVRRIPKSNLIFHRSSGQDTLKLPDKKAISKAKPILDQILCRVSPSLIICEGTTTQDAFEKYFCDAMEKNIDGMCLKTPNGRNMATIYRADRARIVPTGKTVLLIGIGHPSRYGGRDEWDDVIKRSKLAVQRLGP